MTENNYQYLMNGTRLTNYSVIPNTVCEMNISSTAKVIYAKLLNRAQLSASNGFVDSLGRAYVIYTIEDLSKELGKSNSTIKDNLRKLARVGLVEKKRSSKSRANMIFVKVPGTSIIRQFSACNGTEISHIMVQKLSLHQAENRLLVTVIVTRKKYLIMNIGKETVYR